jgi:hypothetical protein
MEFIRLDKSSTISFTMVTNDSPSLALREAKNFILMHRIPECELDMNGFLAMIDPATNLEQILNEFIDWKKHQS